MKLNKSNWRRIALFQLLVGFCLLANAQKPLMPLSGLKKWQTLGSQIKINRNGQYIMFTISDDRSGLDFQKNTLVIKSTVGNWLRKFDQVSFGKFSIDGQDAFFFKTDGQMYKIKLGSDSYEIIYSGNPGNVAKDVKASVSRSKQNYSRIIIDNHLLRKKDSIDNVLAFVINKNNDGIAAVIKIGGEKQQIVWYKLNTGDRNIVFLGKKDQQIVFNQNFKKTNHILFKLQESLPAIDHSMPEVDVWGYKDATGPRPYHPRKTQVEYDYCLNVDTRKIVQITNTHEELTDFNTNHAIIKYSLGQSASEESWNEKAKSQFSILSIADGSKAPLLKKQAGRIRAIFSPDGEYVFISDHDRLDYFSYNVETRNLKDVLYGKKIYQGEFGYMAGKSLSGGTFVTDHEVVIRDDHDVWKLDLSGSQKPVNLTNGFGVKNNLIFRIVSISKGNHEQHWLSKESFGYLLSAMDEKDKSWGFYKLNKLNGENPTMLSMGQYYYGGVDVTLTKATEAPVFILRRESVNEAPNVFTTKDFKSFTKHSDIKPERDFNWIKVETVIWKANNGRECDGQLYKPENFDPAKKYPVITQIYGSFQEVKNVFPSYNSDDFGAIGGNYIPLAWLVSNGYLVFVPNLNKLKMGAFLKETCDLLIPGIEYIGRLPYVNRKKIGLQGASWGGVQTSYIVTQTDLFAAAYSACGLSEMVSLGFASEISRNDLSDYGPNHLDGLITETPQRYIEQSALFSANKVTTPLLLRHNKIDSAPFYHSLQYFSLLRRLGKRAWLLQYDNEVHGVAASKNQEDLYLRMAQFYGYFLKDELPPKWMTEGVSPERKQIDSGLELDASGERP